MRLINQSLDSAGISQSDIDDERWKVCVSPRMIKQALVRKLMSDPEAETILDLRVLSINMARKLMILE